MSICQDYSRQLFEAKPENKTNVVILLQRRIIYSEQASYPSDENGDTGFPTTIQLLSV